MVTIQDVEINLKKLGLDFTLNEDQVHALDHLAVFLKNHESRTTTLHGSAGTGKTAITRVLIDYIEKSKRHFKIVLASPTHKAKAVLKSLSGGNHEVVTLHKLLGLRPNVSLEEFDARNVTFEDMFDYAFELVQNIFLIDECSMINDDLFDLIIEKLAVGNSKIIFIGDIAQLAPVKQELKSKVFNNTDYPSVKLHKVERQSKDNPLLGVLTELREEAKLPNQFETLVGEKGGIYVHENINAFVKVIRDTYNESSKLKSKIVAFRNQRVEQYNDAIRKVLGYKDFIVVDEVLMGNDNYDSGRNNDEIFNANDYVVTGIEKVKQKIPFYKTIEGYNLKLYDPVDRKPVKVFLIDPEDHESINDLAEALERTRLRAIDKATPYMSKKTYWQAWYAMNKSFVTMVDLMYDGRVIKKATLKYGYAITAHKSQGSTYENVFVDILDIMRCHRVENIRSLQYVALSRASNNVHLLC